MHIACAPPKRVPYRSLMAKDQEQEGTQIQALLTLSPPCCIFLWTNLCAYGMHKAYRSHHLFNGHHVLAAFCAFTRFCWRQALVQAPKLHKKLRGGRREAAHQQAGCRGAHGPRTGWCPARHQHGLHAWRGWCSHGLLVPPANPESSSHADCGSTSQQRSSAHLLAPRNTCGCKQGFTLCRQHW